MKAIYLILLFIVMLGFTSCSDSDNFQSEDQSSLALIKATYGAEAASLPIDGVEDIPSVTSEDAQSILEALNKNSNTKTNCLVEISNEKYFGSKNEISKRVIMGSQYRAFNSRGTLLESFDIKVELKFSIENGQVYYFGTDYNYNSDLFKWRANGLSLSPVKNADGCTYEFESTSFIYFKVTDESNCIIQVPVVFKGNYNFKAETGTYCFQLLKYNR